MANLKRKVLGLFEEPTTYKNDFCSYEAAPRANRETRKEYLADDLKPRNEFPAPFKSLKTITSNDTLQRLDYESRPPFCATIRPKEIIATHPQQNFCPRIISDDGLEKAIKTRPRLYVSPAISLDNVEDPKTRKLMVDFTYTTTTSRAGKEAWSNFRSDEPCLPNTVFEKTVDPLALRLRLLPDIPVGFKTAARKWDSIQERYRVDKISELSKKRQNIDYEKKLAKLLTAEEKDAVKTLIQENKLRLSYDRMPLSYSGFRSQFAIKVPLEIKESSPYDPNLTVTEAIAARL